MALSGNGGINIDTSGFSARELEELGAKQLAAILAAVREHERQTSALPGGGAAHDHELYARVREVTGGRRPDPRDVARPPIR